jgi:hypothetical protein
MDNLDMINYNDYNDYNIQELSDFEKNLIKSLDKNIDKIKEYICENEEGFHISCGIITSIIMLGVFGIIF